MSLQQEMPQADEQTPGTFDDGQEAESSAELRVPVGDDSALAPEENEDQKPKVTFDPDQQAVFDNAIGKKTAAQRSAERETEQLRQELADAKAKLPQATRPEVPPIPDDAFADDFQQQMDDRDKVIADAAAFDARADEAERLENSRQEEAKTAQVAQLQKVVSDYDGRAKTLGISEADLKTAADVVNAHGINNQLVGHILMDEQGPAITKHLAENPAMLDAVSKLTPMQAAVFIEQKVKPSLSGKATSAAPNPATTLNGGGSPPSERGPTGATFE